MSVAARGPRGLFVTGTDTGVGKTLVAAGILRLARRAGRVPIPFKPVETGCAPDPLDALRLWRAAAPPIAAAEICLHALPLPAAPQLAAAEAGVRLDIDLMVQRARALAEKGDFLLVEGAGGLLVPYAGGRTTADLAAAVGLPILIVGRMALGTINHMSLTLAEAERHGLAVAGCILNRTEPDVGAHESGNVELIAAVTGRRPLGVVAHLPPALRDDDDRVADAVRDAVGDDAVRALIG